MFAVTCKGKDGNLWGIYLPVSTWEDAENMVEVLGLDVEEGGMGLLVSDGPLDELSDALLSGGFLATAEAALEKLKVVEAMIEKAQHTEQ